MQTSIISIKPLVSEEQCYETIRQLHWQEGVACPHCDSGETIKHGWGEQQRTANTHGGGRYVGVRSSTPTTAPEWGYDIRTVQELLGHKDVTAIKLKRGFGIQSLV